MSPRKKDRDDAPLPIDSFSGKSFSQREGEDSRKYRGDHGEAHRATAFAKICGKMVRLEIYSALLRTHPELILELDGTKRKRSANPHSAVSNLAERVLTDIQNYRAGVEIDPSLREQLGSIRQLAEHYGDLARSFRGYDPGEETS